MQSNRPKAKVLGHIDGNNFYASCEANFDPSLLGKPVLVLSNNDGCVVARSQEAKDIGIKMGVPVFQIRDEIRRHGIILKSSNYSLYADMSRRFMKILAGFSDKQEVYSIDESFLDMTEQRNRGLAAIGQEMRARCRQWIGLPVCVGFGFSKTQAKLADFLAKKRPEYQGVCDLTAMMDEEIDALFSGIDVGEVWGIGRRLVPRLNHLGIHTVLDLKHADPEYMRQQYSVVLEKTVRELNHISCIELEEIAPPRKSIMSSKGFGADIFDMVELGQALTEYVAEACGKLRQDGSLTGAIEVFIETSRFLPDNERYMNTLRIPLPSPTDDTLKLTSVALWGLKKLFKPGYRYQKAGVMLDNLIPHDGAQADLFSWQVPAAKASSLMTVLDRLNSRYGKGTVRPASQGYNPRWKMRREMKSNNFTTQWAELPTVEI